MLITFLISIALGRLSTHPFRAESNLLCKVCKNAVGSLTELEFYGKIANEHEQAIMKACVKNELMDCSGACSNFLDELKSGDFTFTKENAQKVCEKNNWCPSEQSEFESLPAQNIENVRLINRVQNKWVAGMYKGHTNRTRHEFRRLLGAIVDPELRCKPAKKFLKTKASPGFVAPESFDSETNWPQCAKVIGDIRDQSMCGCCWAFAAASAASDRLCIATNATIMLPLSAENLCFCSSEDGCDGGDIMSPWQYVHDSGLVTGGQVGGTGPFGSGLCKNFAMPHCHHHGPQGDDPYPAEGTNGCPQQSSDQCPTSCDSSAVHPHNVFSDDLYGFWGGYPSSHEGEEAIKEAIMSGGPVETAFTVYADFANYVSGVYSHVSGSMEGGHAVRIVGWGTDNGTPYWKIANSWNPYWGEKGYFRIKRGENECGVENQVTASAKGSVWGHK